MFSRTFRHIKARLFRQKKPVTTAHAEQTTNLAPNQEHSAPTDNSYLQRRLDHSQKKYFDSADHFLKIHEVETEVEQANLLKIESLIEITEEAEAALEKDRASVPPAPLETALSEIIDEIKPKESV